MDVLKDITEGLRPSDGSSNDEDEQTEASDGGERAGASDRSDRESSAPTAGLSRAGESATASESSKVSRSGESSESDESTRTDGHLCSFCETEFDAGRDTCPECDAEIVLRGAR